MERRWIALLLAALLLISLCACGGKTTGSTPGTESERFMSGENSAVVTDGAAEDNETEEIGTKSDPTPSATDAVVSAAEQSEQAAQPSGSSNSGRAAAAAAESDHTAVEGNTVVIEDGGVSAVDIELEDVELPELD